MNKVGEMKNQKYPTVVITRPGGVKEQAASEYARNSHELWFQGGI